MFLHSVANKEEPVYYCQRDNAWSSQSFTNSTIGESGCGITCAAMACSAFNVVIDPGEMAELYELVYPNQVVKGTNPKFFQYVCGLYDLEYRTATLDELPQIIADGWLIIVDLPKDTKWCNNKHYILLTAYDGEQFTVLDPEKTKNKKAANKKSRATLNELATASFYCIRR